MLDQEFVELANIELERRKVFEPLRFFKPNGAQERFLNAFKHQDSKIVLFPAGNWVGKTAVAIVALGAIIWPEQAEHEIFNDPIFKDWGKTGFPKHARIISTPKELEDIGSIQTEIKKWWPTGKYIPEKKGKNFFSQFKAKDWVIDIMSYDQKPEEFEGASIGLFIFNEPPPEAIFNACLSRRKFGAKIVMPMTPLMGSAWIFDRIVARDGLNGNVVVYGATEENCREHGKNGVLPHEAIEDLANSCDPDEREARLNGKFLALSGNIFKTFDRNIHVAKEHIEPLPTADTIEHIQCVDPATGKPLAVLWAQVDGAGRLYVYDEYPDFDFATAKESNLVIQDYVKIFREREKFEIKTRILDRHFGNNRSWTGQSLKQDFAQLGLFYLDSYNCDEEVETGILRVKEYLAYDRTKPLSNLNRPAVLISPKCKNLIKSLERWSRNPKTGKPVDDCWKDFCDVFRYICAYRPLPTKYSATVPIRKINQDDKHDTSNPFNL